MSKAKRATTKLTGPNEWLRPFMNLRQSLQASKRDNCELHHSIFLTQRHDISNYVDQLEPWYKNQTPPFQTIPVDVGGGVWAHHCFFGNHMVLKTLVAEVSGVKHWLDAVPREARDILPIFGHPEIKSKNLVNLIRWICVLYHLAFKYQDDHLQAELSYSDAEINGELTWGWWGECPAKSECDPMPLITLVPSNNGEREVWQPGGGTADDEYPDYLEASLETDLLEASLDAVTLIKYYGVEPKMLSIGPEPVPPRKKGRKGPDEETLKEAGKLWGKVIDHHFPEGKNGPKNRKHLKQTEMAVLMGWPKTDQYKVHRHLKRLFTTARGGEPSDEAVNTIYKNMATDNEIGFDDFMRCYGNLTRDVIPKKLWKHFTNQESLEPEDQSNGDEDEE